jgi:hypothetical protein
MPFDGKLYEGRIAAFEKIDQVIDLLATPDRWCKGSLQTTDGRRCLVGAMQAAGAVGVLRRPVLRAIRDVTGRHFISIEFFNDCHTTDHALMLQVLHRVRTNILYGVVDSEDDAVRSRSAWLRGRLLPLMRLRRAKT